MPLDSPLPQAEILAHNRRAWDAAVEYGSEWTLPVAAEEIAAARRGNWHIRLTPTKSAPRAWFPPLDGCHVLCLAGGGGQQGPVLAAAGAIVTVFDIAPKQLARDREVAARDNLALHTVLGDMADLSAFADETFELVVHPCSNLFVPNVRPVWRECFRVLRPGGHLLAAFMNPAKYIFDQFLADDGTLMVRHALPYSDLTNLAPAERQRLVDDEQPLEWSHTLDDQIGGQIDAGFVIDGFYEDRWPGNAIDAWMSTFIATRAHKP